MLTLETWLATSNVMVLPYASAISDHYLIKFLVLVESMIETTIKAISSLTTTSLSELLPLAPASFSSYKDLIDNLMNNFNAVLSNALDTVAPVRLKTHPQRLTP